MSRQKQKFDLPVEIWKQIFSQVEDLRSIVQVCSLFRQIAWPMFWQVPPLKENSIGINELKNIAKLNLPIKELKLSQLRKVDDIKLLKKLVTFILGKFALESFELDYASEWVWIESGEVCEQLCRLPITKLKTANFHAPIIDALSKAKLYPRLNIDNEFYENMMEKDWDYIVKCHIEEISLCEIYQFNARNAEQMIIDNMHPLPIFNIDQESENVQSYELSRIRKLKINKINLKSFDLSSDDTLSDFLRVLQMNDQCPIFQLPMCDCHCIEISLDELEKLFQFPLDRRILNTKCFIISHFDGDKFIDIIKKKNEESPFEMLMIDKDVREKLTTAHINALESMGMFRYCNEWDCKELLSPKSNGVVCNALSCKKYNTEFLILARTNVNLYYF